MTRPHYYDGLDTDSKITLEIDMRSLAERIVGMNYGEHRLLSHLIDARRARLAARIVAYRQKGLADVADSVQRRGDPLADGIEALLLQGLV